MSKTGFGRLKRPPEKYFSTQVSNKLTQVSNEVK